MCNLLYPGSFDPITNGHINVIEKAIKFFGHITIAVMKNSNKNAGFFTLKERYEIIEKVFHNSENVSVIFVDTEKAVIDVALENNCAGIIKGLRNVTDYEVEVQMARINKKMSNNKIETIMFVADGDMQDISSSLVRELFRLKKDISNYVPKCVEEAMKNKK